MSSITIIGSGLAGYTFAREFRKLDKDTSLTLITSDAADFYSKPMLSTALAQGKTAETLVMTPAKKMAEQLSINIIANVTVTSINPENKSCTLKSEDKEEEINYDRLILALGADPIRIPFTGNANDDVISVNDLADYAKFRERLNNRVKRIAIVGAGLIGCEFTNDLLSQSYQVDVIGLGETPLDTLIPAEAGKTLKNALADAGVEWHLGTTIKTLNKQGNVFQIELENGHSFAADLVLSAIGLRARTELAKQAGVAVNKGIVVDATLQSSDQAIYALGDCAEVEGQVLPYVMPIMHGARALAKTLASDANESTAVAYPIMPVVVKTTLHPIVIAGFTSGDDISWQTEHLDDGVKMIAGNKVGKSVGFCLAGATANKEKQSLLKELI